jgi:probable rRNA maturation factor
VTLKRMQSRIQVINRQRRVRINRKAVISFCVAALRSLNQPPTTVSVALVNRQEIHALNSRYRDKDYATDVLSFSYEKTVLEDGPFLGEIVLAPEIADKQASTYHTTLERELRKLLVHGILHLLGFDHESDRGRMNRIQTKLMRRRFFTKGPMVAGVKVKR